MTNATKAFVVLLALVVSFALAACGGSDDDTTTGATTATTTEKKSAKENARPPTVPTIVVRNGEPVGGVEELEYNAGEQVRFRVRSDAADEVHVHGYDIEEEIPAGGTASLAFPADIEGIFEVELHGSEEQIAELRVNP